MKILFTLILSLIISEKLFSQGCSDAGFCTMGANDSDEKDSSLLSKNKLITSFANGSGDDGVYVFTPSIQYERLFNKHWGIQNKITLNYANGNLGNNFGLGDYFLTTTYQFEKKWKKNLLFGLKIPLGNSNQTFENRVLPMQYQSSLGTIDLLLGFTLKNKHWQFSTAFQKPLANLTKNEFNPVLWNNPAVVKYPASFHLKRKSDVLLRFKYLANLGKKLNIDGGLLAIYHLGEDEYTNPINQETVKIAGSSGLTLNFTAGLDYKISSKIFLGLSTGMPLVVRTVRPDGLTRSFVVSPEIIFKF